MVKARFKRIKTLDRNVRECVKEVLANDFSLQCMHLYEHMREWLQKALLNEFFCSFILFCKGKKNSAAHKLL